MIKNKELIFTKQAEDDLHSIYDYIKNNDSADAAQKIYYSIKDKCTKLKSFSNIGHIPPELEILSIYNYFEINFKPYRIIYNITKREVIIFGIFDGRRNLSDILAKRLLK
ncbi:MAG: type II toxin-antitoxin system RelE/ParE family toxin [Candidatus Cloacimonetes bacterium]|nr:type II toxin-antitoxin system RelE/ParE family toxin [Candidatus Cloacimonadota bacterium]MCF7813860.1 type II toxin-antitoxin system RelE/ParE family toxin [Candidatus Cloacimonadota bacterium]MCF7868298.1 type II toxin-antitoxin system RelE/ParE family toxin [Candidatus Cloacimonadota bacterium]MCF7883728.1 type II toxin-antitoxin system RelE/ParE family toxin [Candidatus Cloacimonadota bacterium]